METHDLYTPLIWLAVFGITFAETWISALGGRADRQSTYAPTHKYSLISAHWAALFDLVLTIDMLVIAAEGWTVAPPIIVGAWLGQYIALEKRRKAERAKAKEAEVLLTEEDA